MIKPIKQKKTTQSQTINPADTPVMNPGFDQCSLYLCPEQAAFKITPLPTLITALQEIALISKQINPQKANHHYFIGDRYLDYIAYLGCAPAIQFEANEDNNKFCFIKIHQHQTATLIYSQKQSKAPQCPHCKKPVKEWENTITASTIHCGQCHSTASIEDFNWRKMAGYAQLFIEITDIFPKEAIPQQLLLDKLSNISNVDWHYFFSCQQAITKNAAS